ncbi:MAG TPA: enoyl-CoA hydratase/isomerase family protein [Candidatus Kryptonia bacterium]|nr:enoyl-CoA hydratase/isomerase family protein [Candidatus Kryptonia bacterium]
MAAGHVVIEHDGPVAVMRLNRPPANAFDLEFARELEAAFAQIRDSDAARAIVVTGIEGYFSAGIDLKRVPLYGPSEQRAMITTINRMIASLYACPKPVVAAVNGHAIAGGLIFALASDYRVGTAAPCKIGITEARAGIPFPAAAMAVLKAELAANVGRRLTLRAQNIAPDEALASGVFDELQPPARVLPAAITVANELASIPTQAYARIKQQLRGDTIAFMNATNEGGTDPLLKAWLTAETGPASEALLRDNK